MKKSSIKKCKLHVDREASEANQMLMPDPLNLYEGQSFDIMLHAWFGKLTGWLSPAALSIAWHDWFSHLLISPTKQFLLLQKSWDNASQLVLLILNTFGLQGLEQFCTCKTAPEDDRFKEKAWQQFPFNFYAQSFLHCENWWDAATKNIRGVSAHHENVMHFMARQILDMMSPSNFVLTNPEIINKTIEKNGENFITGYHNFVEDFCRIKADLPPAGTEKFQVGKDVAVTPGQIVYRNQLIELIQYKPKTKSVYAEPVFIIPAWIMKYYILDLSPQNSLVKYLLSKGHDVFILSWKNPTSKDRNLGMEDYLNLGILQSIDQINQIVPKQKIHAVGYCLGGTLLTIAAAALAAKEDDRIKSLTLFASEVDFKDSGELSLFIDQSQVTYLEDIMWEQGYLDGKQMAWAFSMLRPTDLIWSRMIHDYLLGQRQPIIDLMAWDYDTTRLPYRMHSEYLHDLYLNNNLVQGHYKVDNKRVALTDIKVPIFVVATQNDHVSPWRSVYKIHLFTNTDVTFVLTKGGHNAGIVSEPGHKDRDYRILLRKKDDAYIGTDQWLENAHHCKGSWWPAWNKWLDNQSSGKLSAKTIYQPNKYRIFDAPGTYVLQK